MYEFHFTISFTIVWTKEGLKEQQEAINKKIDGNFIKNAMDSKRSCKDQISFGKAS